jgi:hypothetical protein
MLPGWYGAGTAFESWTAGDEARLARLRALYERWPFFRTVRSNMGMVLAKSDLGIARRYATLVPDAELGRQIFDVIVAEHERTVRRRPRAARPAGNPAHPERPGHRAAEQRVARPSAAASRAAGRTRDDVPGVLASGNRIASVRP